MAGNVIFIHPDGTDPSHFAFGRFATVGPDGSLNWDRMTEAGVYLGHLDDQIVATSNAGAVVHAYGIKAVAESYGLDENGEPYAPLSSLQLDRTPGTLEDNGIEPGTTIMEEAIAAGKPTAVINSGFIAEPGTGVFLATVENRSDVAEITEEIVRSGVNVILGGGEVQYLPEGTVGRFGEEGIRTDGLNLIEEAREMGYEVVYTLEELQDLPRTTDKVLGIFAAEDTYNDTTEGALRRQGFVNPETGELIFYGQPPENPNPPTTAEMLASTLSLNLFREAEDGFMIVLEEEATDNFGNNNNGPGVLEAVLRADAAIGVALDFVDNVNSNTLVLTAADSAAGGLEISDVSGNRVGDVNVQPPFGPNPPLDGQSGNNTEPFITGSPDENGDIFPFGVGWAGLPDFAGSIVSKAYGLNAENLPATVDNTGMYRLMYQTLFDVLLDAPEGVPDDFAPRTAPEPTSNTGNVIFIHPDGTSPSHYGAARFAELGPDGRLNWDMMSESGVYKGHIDDRLVATSNAGAVVHAYGIKPYNESYGLDENGEPYTPLSGQGGMTIMEEAQAAGKAVGVINSGFIAEPGTGVFLADAVNRGEVAEITAEILESGAEVILGAGETQYLPQGTIGFFGEEGIRTDGRNLIEEAEDMGYTVVYTLEQLQAVSPEETEKLLGIFAAEDTYNDTTEANLINQGLVNDEGDLILYGQPPDNLNPPTVAQMLEAALPILNRDPDGFMLVLEEEGTDNFGNSDNAAGVIEAAMRADEAIGVAMNFVDNVDPNTLIITAADSDAGGLEVIDVPAGGTVGSVPVQPNVSSSDALRVPLDGQTGNNTTPFVAEPDANGDTHEFGVAFVGTPDFNGGIVSKTYGLNSELLESTIDNTDIYRIMYRTLFGVAPEEVAAQQPLPIPEFGNSSRDTLFAEDSGILFGGSGNDRLFAATDSLLFGNGGDDQLFVLTEGGSRLTGGSGADQFWIANGEIPEFANTIADFTPTEGDVIGIGGIGVQRFNQLSFTQAGDDTLINIPGSNQSLAILLDVEASSLRANNFVIA
jgi:glycerophosphoryl diester phosphodiesterase